MIEAENIKRHWLTRLFDMDDRTVSSTNVYTFIITIVGILLLAAPFMAILTELYYTHTVTMSWGDIASYIGAVAAMFASAGITKAWTSWSNAKYNVINSITSNGQDQQDVDDMSDDSLTGM